MFISPAQQVHKQTLVVRLAITILFLIVIAIIVIVALDMPPDKRETTPFVIAGVLAVICAACWVLIGKTVLSIHPEGVRRTSAFGQTELLWEEIAETRFRAVPVQAGGGLIGYAAVAAARRVGGKAATTSLRLDLIGRDKRRIKITSNFQRASEAIGAILGHIQPKMLADAKRRVEQGESVEFGPLTVSRQGVAWKRKEPVPFSELSKAAIFGRYLRLKRKGKMLDICRVGTEKIPNVLVFLDLIESYGAGAGESQAIDPLARVQ